jgi:transcriptional regulator with XRE-family HTH domain
MVQCPLPVGDLLREWRQRRRLSQLELACEAEISTRHLSFVETGRATPSREMVMNLAERLEVPLRDRNTLLLAAGFAPVYRERPLADPALHVAQKTIDLLLLGQEPYPALAIDRHWTMVASNRAVASMLTGITASLLEPPVNVLRLSLHPNGLARRIANLSEWRSPYGQNMGTNSVSNRLRVQERD